MGPANESTNSGVNLSPWWWQFGTTGKIPGFSPTQEIVYKRTNLDKRTQLEESSLKDSFVAGCETILRYRNIVLGSVKEFVGLNDAIAKAKSNQNLNPAKLHISVFNPDNENSGTLAAVNGLIHEHIDSGGIAYYSNASNFKDLVNSLQTYIKEANNNAPLKELTLLSHGSPGKVNINGSRDVGALVKHLIDNKILQSKSILKLSGCQVAESEEAKSKLQEIADKTGITIIAYTKVQGAGFATGPEYKFIPR